MNQTPPLLCLLIFFMLIKHFLPSSSKRLVSCNMILDSSAFSRHLFKLSFCIFLLVLLKVYSLSLSLSMFNFFFTLSRANSIPSFLHIYEEFVPPSSPPWWKKCPSMCQTFCLSRHRAQLSPYSIFFHHQSVPLWHGGFVRPPSNLLFSSSNPIDWLELEPSFFFIFGCFWALQWWFASLVSY